VRIFTTLQHNTLQHTATQFTATHCNTLQHTATHCNTSQRVATHCNACVYSIVWRGHKGMFKAVTLHHDATRHTATHCNTLQHTATHTCVYHGREGEQRDVPECDSSPAESSYLRACGPRGEDWGGIVCYKVDHDHTHQKKKRVNSRYLLSERRMGWL